MYLLQLWMSLSTILSSNDILEYVIFITEPANYRILKSLEMQLGTFEWILSERCVEDRH